MAILLDLANELLLQILDSLTPIDMVSFATSCKQINTLAQDNLSLHRQRIKEYQKVTLWGCFRHQDQAHPISLLRDICNDWRVAYYARSLAIECCGRDPVGPDEGDRDEEDPDEGDWLCIQTALIAQDAETVKSVLPEIAIPVREKLCMAFRWSEAKIDKTFERMEDGAWGARGAILGLLTVSLPAVKSISFERYVWHDELWIGSMRRITNQQDSFFRLPKANFLMDLSELNLIDHNEGSFAVMSCSVMPFVTRPSLRVIRAASVERDSFNDYHFFDNHGLPPSPVTEIDLQRTSLPAHNIEFVLRFSHVLKRFRYDRRHQPDFPRNGAEPGTLVNVLFECASQCLESLTLTGDTSDRSPYDENIEGSLCNFKVLKELHFPSNAFLTYTSEGTCRFLHTEDIPKLVDVLPASIETVRLDGEMMLVELAALLIGLPEYQTARLPKLKEILFTANRYQGETPKQIEALAHLEQKQGMVLQLDEAKSPGYAVRYSGRFVF